MNDLRKVLGHYFYGHYDVGNRNCSEIEWVNARELLVSERFDLIAKMIYIEAYDTGRGMEWAEELYKAHIRSFSNGREPGNSEKNSVEAYVDVFNKLIDTIKLTGFDEKISVIPVGENNQIMDGAHRVSIAAYYNLSIPIVRIEGICANNNFLFFRDHLLDEKYLDYIAYKYSCLQENVHIACVWPKAFSSDTSKFEKMEELMKQYGDIFYEKEIDISYQTLRNLMIQVYSGFQWMGGIDTHFKGATGKADACYASCNRMKVYVLNCASLEKTLELKAKIRDIFGQGNHSIHISDTQEEAIQIAQLLLNENSIHILTYGNPDKYIKYYKKLMDFSKKCIDEKIDMSRIILIGDSVLGIYGLKDSDNVQFLNNVEMKTLSNCDELMMRCIYNPQLHFYYGSLKFLALNILLKDQLVPLEIRKCIEQLCSETTNKKNRITEIKVEFMRKYRNIRAIVRDWLSEKGMIDIPMKIYHFLCGRK